MTTPPSTDKDLWVSWDEYHRMIERLALKVYESGWKFDQVLCLARGGVRPGDVFSRIFDVPLAILSTSSYREEAGTVRGDLDIAKYMTMTKGPLSGKILLVAYNLVIETNTLTLTTPNGANFTSIYYAS